MLLNTELITSVSDIDLVAHTIIKFGQWETPGMSTKYNSLLENNNKTRMILFVFRSNKLKQTILFFFLFCFMLIYFWNIRFYSLLGQIEWNFKVTRDCVELLETIMDWQK